MAPYVNIFSGGPNGSLGKTIADDYQAMQRLAPQMAAVPQNALLQGASNTPQSNIGSAGAPRPIQFQGSVLAAPDMTRELLKSAISHVALLSDTPEKWAATIAMLKKNGIDPGGYEGFENGRPLAVGRLVPIAVDDVV